jgi:hypothetical protein
MSLFRLFLIDPEARLTFDTWRRNGSAFTPGCGFVAAKI